MRYSSRFFLYAPLALLLALAGLVSLHWWRTADAFEARLAALKGHEALPGVTLDWSNVTVSGFPFRMDATFDGFVAQGAGAHGPFAWRSEHFALHALTYGARKTVFEAAGNQHLSWNDAAGAAHSAGFLPGSLRASAVRDASGLSRFDLEGIELAGQSGNGNLRIGKVQFHMRRDPDGKSIDLMAAADAVMAAAPPGSARNFRIYQTLSHGSALAGLLRGEKAPPQAHALWLLAGGKAAITQAEWNGKKNALTPEQSAAALTLLSPLY